jgi:hypothetical protein
VRRKPALDAATASESGTLKERLSDKASDDQRVNDGRVPVNQRGRRNARIAIQASGNEVREMPIDCLRCFVAVVDL